MIVSDRELPDDKFLALQRVVAHPRSDEVDQPVGARLLGEILHPLGVDQVTGPVPEDGFRTRVHGERCGQCLPQGVG